MPRVSIRCNGKSKLRLLEILKNTVECPFDPQPISGCKKDGKCIQCTRKNVRFVIAE